MSVDFKKLRNFVKVIDAGSMSRAASILRTAQPALSQQLAALEAHFRQKLLIRSNHGIAPTEAGLALYRHAQILLKQLDQAEVDVVRSASTVAGHVSIGLATYGATGALSLPLLKEMAARHPGVVVYINDSFGHVLSELIMTGPDGHGGDLRRRARSRASGCEPLFREELFLVAPTSAGLPEPPDMPLPLSALDGIRLLVPGRAHLPAPPHRRVVLPRPDRAAGRGRDRVGRDPRRRGQGRARGHDPAVLGGGRHRGIGRHCRSARSRAR